MRMVLRRRLADTLEFPRADQDMPDAGIVAELQDKPDRRTAGRILQSS